MYHSPTKTFSPYSKIFPILPDQNQFLMKVQSYFILLLTLHFIACNSSKDAKDMEGEAFKQAHEIPEKVDFNATGEAIKFDTPDGKTGTAYAIGAKNETKNYLFVIHEWWGLNDNIRQEAQRLAEALPDVHVLALDLYDGNVADNRDDASKYMQAVKQERAEAIIKGALAYVGTDAKVATIGWCFGGGWSLRASILAGKQGTACVWYYGMPVKTAQELAPIKADILGIIAEKDQWITPQVGKDFDALAQATGKNFELHVFDADHAFANPSSPRFVEAAAEKANALSLAFLKERF